jgi:peptide-methionine (S)-S-oxide reductase
MFYLKIFKRMVQLMVIGLSLLTTVMSCGVNQSTPSVSEAKKGGNDVKKVLATMQTDSLNKEEMEIATLGGGCFWCIEAVFEELKGVQKSVSGYTGGKVENPTYREVCYGNTGHAEVVDVYFDPKIVSYEDILRVFFHVHDPTTPNRQGNDIGTQYRSAIFYHNEAQQASAKKIIEEIEKSNLWDNKIVTEVSNFTRFYAAEESHQEYYKLNGHAPYCQYVISPKMSKFRKEFKDRLKSSN